MPGGTGKKSKKLPILQWRVCPAPKLLHLLLPTYSLSPASFCFALSFQAILGRKKKKYAKKKLLLDD
jgi:hypothetical protein